MPITSSQSLTSSFVLATTDNIITSKNNIAAFVISGSSTIRIGEYAGSSATNATNATMLGYQAGQNATTASNATILGYRSGYNSINAEGSTIIGRSAGQNATTASNATMLGYYAGFSSTAAASAVLIGNNAGQNATNATNATIIGTNAGTAATNANSATIIGNYAGYIATNATNATLIGYFSGQLATTSSYATIIGSTAGQNTTNATEATIIGYTAGQNATNAAAATLIGYQAGRNATESSRATLCGYQAGYNTSNAYGATILGYSAGYNLSQGIASTVIGYQAGQYATNANYSTMIGAYAGDDAKTGSNSTFIGYAADTLDANLNVAKSVAIGYNAKVSGSSMMVLGGTGADALNVGINTTSPTARLEVVGDTKISGSLNVSQSVTVGGQLIVPAGTAAAPSLAISDSNDGFYERSDGRITMTLAGTAYYDWTVNNMSMRPNVAFGWFGDVIGGTFDLGLWRDAANTLAQRNGTSPQTSRLYGTYTSLADHQRLSLSHNGSGSATIAVETSGSTGLPDQSLRLVPAGTGSVEVTGDVNITGTLYAAAKSFLIQHPTKANKKLQHGSLEGPEYGVYIRGKLTNNSSVIDLPDYWAKLVDPGTITVQLTPINRYQKLFVQSVSPERIVITNANDEPAADNNSSKQRSWLSKLGIVKSGNQSEETKSTTGIEAFYVVYAERKDIGKMRVEL
jgi:hypothetical protein